METAAAAAARLTCASPASVSAASGSRGVGWAESAPPLPSPPPGRVQEQSRRGSGGEHGCSVPIAVEARVRGKAGVVGRRSPWEAENKASGAQGRTACRFPGLRDCTCCVLAGQVGALSPLSAPQPVRSWVPAWRCVYWRGMGIAWRPEMGDGQGGWRGVMWEGTASSPRPGPTYCPQDSRGCEP